jgi:hypothetical protein
VNVDNSLDLTPALAAAETYLRGRISFIGRYMHVLVLEPGDEACRGFRLVDNLPTRHSG